MTSRQFLLLTILPVFTSLSLSGTVAGAPAPSEPTESRQEKAAAVRQQLDAPVNFAGFDDPDTKLDDIVKYFERAYGLQFEVNERAFRDEDPPETNVLERRIGKALDKMRNVRLSMLLRRLLDCYPSGATWVVRSGYLEITTQRAYRAEFYPDRPNGPFPPLVIASFEKKPLEEALKQLADIMDTNIVLDGRAADKAKTPVTARFTNVPLDTAVMLLADMADLKSVDIGGVYYVTAAQNAEALRKEQEKRRPAKVEEKPAHPMPEKKEPDPPPPLAPAEVERLIKEREEEVRRLKGLIEKKEEPAPKKQP